MENVCVCTKILHDVAFNLPTINFQHCQRRLLHSSVMVFCLCNIHHNVLDGKVLKHFNYEGTWIMFQKEACLLSLEVSQHKSNPKKQNNAPAQLPSLFFPSLANFSFRKTRKHKQPLSTHLKWKPPQWVIPSDFLLERSRIRRVELNSQTHGERRLSWRKQTGNIWDMCEDNFNNCQQSAETWNLTSAFRNVFGQINL